MTGKMLDERLGKWNFWVMFLSFNLGFFPMHISGLLGMPRRIYTYLPGMGWSDLNLITSIGAFIFAIGVVLFVINIALSLRHGRVAGPNPWDGGTLEWATPSPPPPYNFVAIPEVSSRHPLWDDRLRRSEERSALHGLVLDQGKESLGTDGIDGEPRVILKMPEDSLTPFFLSLAVSMVFVGMLLRVWWLVVISMAATLVLLTIWLWPRASLGQTAEVADV
jgi:cytochrome c oxidase subunit 1/cytochrome c oxidase subunit I+III